MLPEEDAGRRDPQQRHSRRQARLIPSSSSSSIFFFFFRPSVSLCKSFPQLPPQQSMTYDQTILEG
jgi:hypothetical protein